MSYDWRLQIDAGGPEPLEVDGDDIAQSNYTYNVYPMLRDACERAGGEWLGSTGSARCGDVAPVLTEAARLLTEDVEHYDAMNPSNGWGNREGAARWLDGIAKACRSYPDATLVIC